MGKRNQEFFLVAKIQYATGQSKSGNGTLRVIRLIHILRGKKTL